jgi:hypothetical protein
MTADRLGDAFAAGQPGAQELVGVGPVDLGTGRAAGGAAGAACLQYQPVGLPGGVEHRPCLPGGGINVVYSADQPDRVLAVPGRSDLPLPLCVVVRVACAGAQVSQEAVAE